VSTDTATERVDWAGLPVNLDMVFSQRQRDKVYAQHLMRTRAAGKELRAAEPTGPATGR
jgi:sulfite reductase alpha subunit-like flavoprotein